MAASSNALDQARTMLLLRTMCLVTNAIVLVWNLQEDLLIILNGDAITMERWDPSDIIAAPFPVENLFLAVSKSCRSIMIPNEFILSTLLLYYQGRIDIRNFNKDSMNKILKSSLKYMLMMAILNMLIFVLVILCGASPSQKIYHTALATIYLTTLAFGYIQPSLDVPIKMSLERVILGPDYSELTYKESLVNELNCYILFSTFLVTIPFTILTILDHGDQNQRWPIPIILGSLCGHLVGIVISTIVGVYRLYGVGARKASMVPLQRNYVSPPKVRMA